ncbi:hypothetical protein Kyoto89A_04320 [Helicobacter pylori]|nr:part of outer membrane protein HorA [Helicobacter pylori]
MKKSFKKLGFVSLATSSVLLGSMNATDLQTYATLQKPSHVFGNYVAKTKEDSKDSKKGDSKDSKEGNSGDQASQQQQAKPPPQATAKKQAPLRTPLLLTAPQRLLIKLIQTAPTPL